MPGGEPSTSRLSYSSSPPHWGLEACCWVKCPRFEFAAAESEGFREVGRHVPRHKSVLVLAKTYIVVLKRF